MSEWRDIPGYEGLYRVSDDGEVWSVRSKRLLRPSKHQYGYHMYMLCVKFQKRLFSAHRLVLLAFVGERPENAVIRHLNDNPTDNRLCNLAYGTQKENLADARANGFSSVGERNGTAKLSSDDVAAIKRKLKAPYRGLQVELAKEYGVNRATITAINIGKNWSHL